ncbi:MAG: transglycosylase SLT domain-containing protein [bacterium]|nr:transglycosylase SLT domain-containing protein [bacterium]
MLFPNDPVAARLAQHGVEYAPAIAAAARRHGLDPTLLAAVAAQETGGPGANAGRNVVGDGGHGHGLFQIDDRWHAFASSPAAMDPAKNADYAAGMLAGLLRRYGGDAHAALSAYNAGDPRAVGTKTTWADGARLGYADSVLRHERALEGGEPLESARAESQATAEAVNAPLQGLQGLQASLASLGFSAPSLPPPWRPHSPDLDATGHKRATPSDADAAGEA